MPSRALALVALLGAAACGRPSSSTGNGAPPGTPARYDDRIFPGGVPPAQIGPPPSVNPSAGDSVSAREGGEMFVAMNCDGCHGGGATGWVGPSLVDGRWRYGASDAEVFLSIYYGRPKGMPAYGGVLTPGVVWKLVSYLRSQPPPKDAPTERW